MATQNLSDLNGYLFTALERLDSDDLDEDQLRFEIKRAQAIVGVSQTVIANAAIYLKTEHFYDGKGSDKPKLLE